MKERIVLLVVILSMSAVFSVQASEYGRIAIFADESRSTSEVWHTEEYTIFDIYIFCLPGDNGMMCAEFSVDYPENVLPSTVTGNPGLSVAIGSLDGGMSVCFSECRNDWVWTHRQSIILTGSEPSKIEIEAHPAVGTYQFGSCEEGFPLENILYSNPLFINSAFAVDEDPPQVTSSECPDQEHIIVHFDEPLYAENALQPENFTVIPYYGPDWYGPVIPSVPACLADGDMTVTLITGELMQHNQRYRVTAAGVMDRAGNVLDGSSSIFTARDTYPPTYHISHVYPEKPGITVVFSEPVQPFNAERASGYWMYGPQGIDVIDADLQPNGTDVELLFDVKLRAGGWYTLWARWVQDLAGNAVAYEDRAYFSLPDTFPPEIVEISGVTTDVLQVRFNEDVELATALDPGNYEVLERGDPGLIIGVTEVRMDITPDWFYLFLERSVDMDEDHLLRYDRICDLLGNCIGTGGRPPLTCTFNIGSIATMVESFEAKFRKDHIEIDWQLSSAVDRDRLTVMKTVGDEGIYSPVEDRSIEAEGPKYRFVDDQIELGKDHRYRVFEISEEGSRMLFETEAVSTFPPAYALWQNRPNPFNPATEIAYSLPEAGHVKIEIFDTSGRRIKCLVDRAEEAGIHRAVWNGMDQAESPVASGIYFYRIKTGKWTEARKMVLIR